MAGWRAGITDGKEWLFYEYDRDAPDADKLARLAAMRLDTADDDETLLAYLYGFVNRTVKMAPPTDNIRWADLQTPSFPLPRRHSCFRGNDGVISSF